ncbi:hypothetical protein [Fervidibacillus halotolerans]|uniref:Uncharacterized protein n=1 Tax=Fervidibacillus halotolerans TaxID=2980027 RepID=A0A9E8M104_9BACI|nr:hypothetical protein [Fervidibacillus halotolerans]WAA13392.1 hypothetical protein OE105_04570 [Fervidibacillus halotolerans]
MVTIKYVRTVVGWFNVTVGNNRYNVAPEVFRKFTGVSSNATLGVAELNAADVDALIKHSIAIGVGAWRANGEEVGGNQGNGEEIGGL